MCVCVCVCVCVCPRASVFVSLSVSVSVFACDQVVDTWTCIKYDGLRKGFAKAPTLLFTSASFVGLACLLSVKWLSGLRRWLRLSSHRLCLALALPMPTFATRELHGIRGHMHVGLQSSAGQGGSQSPPPQPVPPRGPPMRALASAVGIHLSFNSGAQQLCTFVGSPEESYKVGEHGVVIEAPGTALVPFCLFP